MLHSNSRVHECECYGERVCTHFHGDEIDMNVFHRRNILKINSCAAYGIPGIHLSHFLWTRTLIAKNAKIQILMNLNYNVFSVRSVTIETCISFAVMSVGVVVPAVSKGAPTDKEANTRPTNASWRCPAVLCELTFPLPPLFT